MTVHVSVTKHILSNFNCLNRSLRHRFIFLHSASCPLSFPTQGAVVREFFAIARSPQMDSRLPGFRAQQWYFFLVSTFYLYGR